MTHRDMPRFANLRDGGNLHTAADIAAATRALRWMRNACLIAFAVLLFAIWGAKCIGQIKYDMEHHEVIK